MSKVSKNKKKSASRLASVQAVYQMINSGNDSKFIIKDFKLKHLGQPIDGEEIVAPDVALFSKIVQGCEKQKDLLMTSIIDALKAASRTETQGAVQNIEPMIEAILLCGSYELYAHQETDAAIIINDYLHVTHAFLDKGEARLINGVLDKVKKDFRD